MAYNYQGIVNKVLGSFNEVKFSSSTEFDNAAGFQLDMKEALNDILIEIYNHYDQEWPFQRAQTTSVTTIGITGYTPPANTGKVDWDSFYIDTVVGNQDNFTSVTADASGKTFTITAGSFITQGFEVGMQVRWTGVDNNSSTDVTINTLTATVMTVDETVVDATATTFKVQNAFPNFNALKLGWMPIDTYRNNYLPQARNQTETTSHQRPAFVVRDTNNDFILGPGKPDKTYLVKFDYFVAMTLLAASTDIPDIPERYEYVILAGMKRRGNEFRDNVELASMFNKQFKSGLADMRRDLIPFSNTLRFES